MELSPSIPNPDISAAARSAVELLEETSDTATDAATSIADTAIDVASDALQLAAPTVVAAAPTAGRLLWRHKKWLIGGLIIVLVIVAIQRRRSEQQSNEPNEAPSQQAKPSERAAS